MMHATYKEAALGLPQLGVRFLADSNSWFVNGTLKLRAMKQKLQTTDSAGF